MQIVPVLRHEISREAQGEYEKKVQLIGMKPVGATGGGATTMSEDEKKAKRSKKAKTNGTVGLFDPMTLRGVTVRNRIWLPPMDTYSALA